MRIASEIETKLWYSIIEYLKSNDWKIISEYNLFDKGIDFDFYEFEKDKVRIFMAWDNWFEGEIKCSEENFKIIEKRFNTVFEFRNKNNLYLNDFEKFKHSK